MRVYAQAEIESDSAWTKFIDNESIKISQGKLNAVIVLLGKTSVDFVIVTKDKICEICFTHHDEGTWFESYAGVDSRITAIHEMLNGKKFAEEKKPAFMSFGA